MIQRQTRLKVADNSGAKIIQCFNVLGGSKKRYARIGDIIVASVKEADPSSSIKKGDKVRAVIVRQRAPFKRKDGSSLKFDDNAAVILEKEKGILATRIFGPIPRELKEKGFEKIVSMAKFVV